MRCASCKRPLPPQATECPECGFPVFDEPSEIGEVAPPDEEAPTVKRLFFSRADSREDEPVEETPAAPTPPPVPRAPKRAAAETAKPAPRAAKHVDDDKPEPPAKKPRTKAGHAAHALGESPLTGPEAADSNVELKQVLQSVFTPGVSVPKSKPMLLKRPAPKLPPREPEPESEPPAAPPPSPVGRPAMHEPAWAQMPESPRPPQPNREEPEAYALGEFDAVEAEAPHTLPPRPATGPAERPLPSPRFERPPEAPRWPDPELEEDDEEESAYAFATGASERDDAEDEALSDEVAKKSVWRKLDRLITRGWGAVEGLGRRVPRQSEPVSAEPEPDEEEDEEAIRVTVAGAGRRGMAMLFDVGFLAFLNVLFWQLGLHVFGPERLPGGQAPWAVLSLLTDYSQTLSVTALLLFVILSIFYSVLFTATSGQTLGKWICDLRVIQTDGERVSLARAVVRLFGYVLAAAPFFLGFLWIPLDDRQQGIHDKIAQTLVIRHRGGADEAEGERR